MYKTTINYYKIIFITSKKIIKINKNKFSLFMENFQEASHRKQVKQPPLPKKKKNNITH